MNRKREQMISELEHKIELLMYKAKNMDSTPFQKMILDHAKHYEHLYFKCTNQHYILKEYRHD
jgi:hypothetical protein